MVHRFGIEIIAASGRIQPLRSGRGISARMAGDDCHLNRSTQHLISNYREGDVENEVQTENLLHRNPQGIDVGSLAERRFSGVNRSTF